MSLSKEFIIETNSKQTVSETDGFTCERYRQMFRHFPKNAITVLDVGCNTGRGGKILKTLNPDLKITGLDCVDDRLQHLDPAVYEKTICAFSTDIAVPNATYDVIVGGEFIEHVPPIEIDATLAEFFRILKLHGRLILTTPNPYYLKNRFKNLSVLLDNSHATQHYPESLSSRLKMIGYSKVRKVGSGRMTRYIGECCPWLSVYGSYLTQATKW